MESGLGHSVEPFAQILLGAGVSVAFHPMTYTKLLIQLGYEPQAPVLTRSIFGRQVLVYPNVFGYLAYIKRTDGFLGLYRGLSARLLGGIIGSSVSNSVNYQLKTTHAIPEPEIDEDEEALEAFKRVCHETSHEMVARCAGVIASQPCHVIMLRTMAQFVGQETEYNNIFSAIATIYNDEGILGFFAGIVPRLVGEALTIWLVNIVVHVINQYVVSKTTEHKGIKSYTNALCTMMVTQVTYPFSLVSNIMAVNHCGLAAGCPPCMPVYSTWTRCFSSLLREGNIKRGSSLFWRYYKGPIVLRHDGKPMPASLATFS